MFNWVGPLKGKKKSTYAGSINEDGYIRIPIDGYTFRAHRLAWFWVFGKWPDLFVDHINNNRLDNRISNLREAGYSQNQWNKSFSSKNRSGLKGVYFRPEFGKWVSRIGYMGKKKHLGHYETREEAYEVYCLAADLLFGEFSNHGNEQQRQQEVAHV
ncbi:HNH endonuclease [Burkholderia pseudomallei]|uniref:HNH endonuclease n=1 Tax=Burkholderia pseudomallei TaxID=28450 RepID=UPI002E1119B2